MYCPNCGEEIYLIDSFNDVDWLYCENCEKEYSIKDNGAVPKRVESMKVSYFQQEIRDSKRPRIDYSVASQINMHDPNDRLKLAPGEFRVRYTCRNKGA